MTDCDYTWMETYSGRAFDLRAPDTRAIVPMDIAHGLAMQCRFNGQCRRFYSVAEHCIHVANLLAAEGHHCTVQLYGLLHDAEEAYMGDLTSPLKAALPEARAIGANIRTAVRVALGLPAILPEQAQADIRRADAVLLATEAKALMASGGLGWQLPEEASDRIALRFWGPAQAEQRYLERLIALPTAPVRSTA